MTTEQTITDATATATTTATVAPSILLKRRRVGGRSSRPRCGLDGEGNDGEHTRCYGRWQLYRDRCG